MLRDLGRGGSLAPSSSDPTFAPIGPARLADYSMASQRFQDVGAEPPPPEPEPSLLELVMGEDNARALEQRWEDKTAAVSARWRQVTGAGGEIVQEAASGTLGALLDQTIDEIQSGEHSGSLRELAAQTLDNTAQDAAGELARMAGEAAYQGLPTEARLELAADEVGYGIVEAGASKDTGVASDGMGRVGDEYANLADSILPPTTGQ